MEKMTRRELKALFIRKVALVESEQTLVALKEIYNAAMKGGELSTGLPGDIAMLEEKIAKEQADLAKTEIRARETLQVIQDDVGRIGAMLHFCEGMPWKTVAAVLHRSEKGVSKAAYRGMETDGIKK